MLSKLPPRERQIVDILYQKGPLAVVEICDPRPVQLSGSAVSDTVAKKSALSKIVRDFFNGSPARAQLDQLEQMIARARKAKEDK